MGFVLSQYQQVKSTPDFIEAAGAPRPLTNTIVAATGANTYPIGYFDGFLWGINSANLISKSSDMGANWTAVNASGVAATSRLMKCDDGEVIGINGGTLFKSTGWAANPATATFATKVTANGIATFLPWGLDGDGTKFIANSYSAATYSDSRYVRISLDAGATWTTKYDTLTEHGTDFNDTSHQHGCCYDPWHDRFWLSEGHNPPGGTPDLNGLYYSDDDGDTWTRAAGVYPRDESPTVLVATPNGLVLGTDSIPGGVWFLPYEADQTATDAVELYRWINEESRPGIVGFADHGYRDPTTGLVYVGFMSNFPPGVKPFIVATDGRSASRIWDSGTVARVHSLVARNGKLAANCSGHTLRADTTNTLETPHISLIDTGNVLGGTTDNITSLVVGINSTTGSAFRSTAVGLGCSVTYSDSIGIGYGVIVDSERSVQIGDYTTASVGNDVVIAFGATNSGAGSVVIGVSTVCVGTNSVCIGNGTTITAADGTAVGGGATAGLEGTALGRSANGGLGSIGIGPRANGAAVYVISIGSDSAATSTYNVAVGKSSAATGDQSVAVGSFASTGIYATALGISAVASHQNSIALGRNTATTQTDQAMVGPRDIEIQTSSRGIIQQNGDAARFRSSINSKGLIVHSHISGGTALSPSSVAGLVNWWKASDPHAVIVDTPPYPIVEDGGVFGRIIPRAGGIDLYGSYGPGAAIRHAKFNNRQALYLDGVDDAINGGMNTNSTTATVFLVIKPELPAGQHIIFQDDGGSKILLVSGATADPAQYNVGSPTFRVNGVAKDLSNRTKVRDAINNKLCVITAEGVDLTGWSQTITGLRLVGPGGFQGYFLELIVFDQSLSTDNRNMIEQYLLDQYVRRLTGLTTFDGPTADPLVAGAIWSDSGTLKVSAG